MKYVMVIFVIATMVLLWSCTGQKQGMTTTTPQSSGPSVIAPGQGGLIGSWNNTIVGGGVIAAIALIVIASMTTIKNYIQHRFQTKEFLTIVKLILEKIK